MKKFKSKPFCVATEGATTDGRTISADWINQMAETFDSKVYGARVWIEHIRGVLPDSPFKAQGDVVSLFAKKKSDGKLGLFAEIDPTEDLVKTNKARQKVFTSIEVNPDFAGTGKAYLMGLAVTDTPASLGTDMLEFTQKNPSGSPLTDRKLEKENLFSVAAETEIEFEEVVDVPNFSARIKSVLSVFKEKAVKTDGQLDEVLNAVEQVAKHSADQEAAVAAITKQLDGYKGLEQQFNDLKKQFDTFKEEVESTDASTTARPPANGGDGQVLADC